MSLPVLTAVGDARWEADLSTGLSRDPQAVRVVRRCVDLPELLSAAAAGLARAVVLSADLRQLDREALSRLAFARVAVVGLVRAGDEPAERRLRQLGIRQVLPHDAASQTVSEAVLAAVAALDATGEPGSDWADPSPARTPDLLVDPLATSAVDPSGPNEPGAGALVAVWGPAGAPGRTTIAVNLAAELAGLGRSTLLVDADTYGGAVAQTLGILDEAPGLASACRTANLGRLDLAALSDVALALRPGLRVLTGIARPDRWLEIRPSALRAVLDLARTLVAFTVVDCGFCLEQDEELAYDTAAPRRNGATLAVLDAADVVVSVARADPVGLARFARASTDCAAIGSGARITVVNRLRPGVVGPGEPRTAVAAALARYAGITDPHAVPDDPAAVDAALAAGRLLAETARNSPARESIRALAGRIAGLPAPTGRRRLRS